MALVSTGTIIDIQGFVLAVNAITLEQAEAFVLAAAELDQGLVIQLSENTVKFHGGLRPLGTALLELAKSCEQPISIHLDHATDESLVLEAIELGFSSVMFDGSTLEYEKNLAKTLELAQLAKAKDVWFEAELGEVGGKDGVHAPGVRTKPADARDFVDATKVDGLAVAVGSSHAMLEKTASLDLDLIAELARATNVPLVLHGSSGVSREQLRGAIGSGIKKVNLATELNAVFNLTIIESLDPAKLGDPRKYLIPARTALASYLVTLLKELS